MQDNICRAFWLGRQMSRDFSKYTVQSVFTKIKSLYDIGFLYTKTNHFKRLKADTRHA